MKMRNATNATFIVTTFLLSSALPAAAGAQSTGLEDMVGARAGQAEGELQRRGYVNTGGSKGDDRSYTNWWNAARRQCVTIATMNGRYDSITPTTAPDCRQAASMRPRPDSNTRPRPGYAPEQNYPRPPYRPDDGRPSTLPSGPGPVVGGRPVSLGLVCFGDGTRDGIASGTRWTWNSRRDRYDYGSYTETRPEMFDASLMVQTWEGGGRIRLPKSLVPPINSRGNNGWWDLSNVSVGPDEIRATYRLNSLNKPKIVIDRRSGRITVQGFSSYSFRGTCDTIGHDQPRRF
jgi:hypothetical protein